MRDFFLFLIPFLILEILKMCSAESYYTTRTATCFVRSTKLCPVPGAGLVLGWVMTKYEYPVLKYLFYSCAVKRLSYKMGFVSSFWCHICAFKFMLAYIYQAIFRVGGDKRLFEIFSRSCKNSFVVLGKWVERFKKAI